MRDNAKHSCGGPKFGMVFNTENAAYASLREFTPFMRKAHTVVRFWSETAQAWRFTRVMK